MKRQVCCSVLQCVAVCCSVLQCFAVCCSVLQCDAVGCSDYAMDKPPILMNCQVRCSVLQCVAVFYSVLQYVAICCNMVQWVAVCWSVVQYDAVCCAELYALRWITCVALCCIVWRQSHCNATLFSTFTYVNTSTHDIYICKHKHTRTHLHMQTQAHTHTHTLVCKHISVWRRPIGCLKLQDIFRKRATNYRALLRKMTCEGKASSDSTPPCTLRHTLYHYVLDLAE